MLVLIKQIFFRLRELLTLKGHVESVVKLKGLDIEGIQQHYTVWECQDGFCRHILPFFLLLPRFSSRRIHRKGWKGGNNPIVRLFLFTYDHYDPLLEKHQRSRLLNDVNFILYLFCWFNFIFFCCMFNNSQYIVLKLRKGRLTKKDLLSSNLYKIKVHENIFSRMKKKKRK